MKRIKLKKGKAEEVLGGGRQGQEKEDTLLKAVAGTEEAEEAPVDAVEHVRAEEADEEKEARRRGGRDTVFWVGEGGYSIGMGTTVGIQLGISLSGRSPVGRSPQINWDWCAFL